MRKHLPGRNPRAVHGRSRTIVIRDQKQLNSTLKCVPLIWMQRTLEATLTETQSRLQHASNHVHSRQGTHVHATADPLPELRGLCFVPQLRDVCKGMVSARIKYKAFIGWSNKAARDSKSWEPPLEPPTEPTARPPKEAVTDQPSRRPSFSQAEVSPSELEDIRTLLRDTSEEDRLKALRLRRSKIEVETPADPKKKVVDNPYERKRVDDAEVAAINALIGCPAKITERRKSIAPPLPASTAMALPKGWSEVQAPDGTKYYYHRETAKSQWVRPEAPTVMGVSTVTTTKVKVPTVKAPAPMATVNVPSSVNTCATDSLWKDSIMAVKVANIMHDAEDEESPSAIDVSHMSHMSSCVSTAEQLRTNSQMLTGAAARGAKAASLARVKAAASTVGGVFLTSQQWEAMRCENTRLKVSNKRLEKEVLEARINLSERKPGFALSKSHEGRRASPMAARRLNSLAPHRSTVPATLSDHQISDTQVEHDANPMWC